MPNVRSITHEGRSQSLSAWAIEKRIPATTIHARLRAGWEVGRALGTPPDRTRGRGGRKRADVARPCPPLKHHKATARAFCLWHANGEKHYRYFGPWKSAEARSGYARFKAEWAVGGTTSAVPKKRGPTVADLVLAWLAHCEREFRKRGTITSEVFLQRSAMGVLNELYGPMVAAEFGGPNLLAVREAMITGERQTSEGKKPRNWKRKTVNDHTARIVRAFGWGAFNGFVPVAVYQTLQLVDPIAAGRRDDVPEGEGVDPVPAGDIKEVLAGTVLHRNPGRRAVLGAMIRLQLLTGMRPGELCPLRGNQIDRTREPWRYEVREHNKMLHKDVQRVVLFGPAARAELAPFLEACGTGPVFVLPPARKSAAPIAINPRTYRDFIAKACKRARVPVWAPNRLRHNRADDVMDRYEDDEAVAALLGNSPEVARQVYTRNPGEKVAARIAEATG